MSDTKRKTIRVVNAVIERDGRYLITQRRPNAVLPLMWDFPGGRVEEGEADEDALARELRHRLGVSVTVRKPWISFGAHHYERYTVDLYLYECELGSEPIEARAVHDFKWATAEEFGDYTFTPADEASINTLLGES